MPSLPVPLAVFVVALAVYAGLIFGTPHPLLAPPSLPLELKPALPELGELRTVAVSPQSPITNPLSLPPSAALSAGSLYHITNNMLKAHTVGSGPIPLGVSVVIPDLSTPDCKDPSFTAILETAGTLATTHDEPLTSSSIFQDAAAPSPSLYVSGCGRIRRYNPRKSGVLMPLLDHPEQVTGMSLDSYGTLLASSPAAVSYFPDVVGLPDRASYRERADKLAPGARLLPLLSLAPLLPPLSLPPDAAILAHALDCSSELLYLLLSAPASSPASSRLHLVSLEYDPLEHAAVAPVLLASVPGGAPAGGLAVGADGNVWLAAGPLCRYSAARGEAACTKVWNGGEEAHAVGVQFDARARRGELVVAVEAGGGGAR
ncbi:hypothetical protein TeGR_g4377, partial [Tetraparma gracilis]